jgi:hypothetical protein
MSDLQKLPFDKILFLDIDGVLNTATALRSMGNNALAPDLLAILVKIIRATNAKIVLTSTWRNQPDAKQILLSTFNKIGIDSNVIDSTPTIAIESRDQEIRSWLSQHPTHHFAILDDSPEAGRGDLSPHFFEISSIVGLQDSDATKIIHHLNPNPIAT